MVAITDELVRAELDWSSSCAAISADVWASYHNYSIESGVEWELNDSGLSTDRKSTPLFRSPNKTGYNSMSLSRCSYSEFKEIFTDDDFPFESSFNALNSLMFFPLQLRKKMSQYDRFYARLVR